ncbi:MAG: hypothetical protein DBX44_08590 [Oscillospiraceae bacterium]|nr:MAG: hypothetical protein DBX44_08590 [Oscillospiraceae bacterium]
MENERDYEKEQETFTEQELNEEVEWMRALLELDQTEIPLPDSLRSEHLLERLRETEQNSSESQKADTADEKARPRGGRRVLFLKLAACAACFALVFFGWRQASSNSLPQMTEKTSEASAAYGTERIAPASGESGQTQENVAAAAPAQVAAENNVALPEQPVASSYDEVYDAVSGIYEALYGPYEDTVDDAVDKAEEEVQEAPMLDAAMPSPGIAGSSASNAAVSSTNVQVEGVDEADIVKTDGVYLYHYRFDQETGGAQVSIITANGLKLLSTISLPDFSDAELYVSGDRLILVQTAPEERVRTLLQGLRPLLDSGAGEDGVIVPDYLEPDSEQALEPIDMVETVVYDLSDRKNPKEIARYQQDGRYVSSRLSGDTLYLVSNKNLYRFAPNDGPALYYLPVTGENGEATFLDAGDIYLPPYRENLNYAVVSALDLSSQHRETKAVLGMADQIMMSGDALFLTASIPQEGENVSRWNRRDTGVTRFLVTDGALSYLSSGRVSGTVNNQFSLDEYQGNLRIATTSYGEDGEPVNNVFVYDAAMELVGSVEGLAPGETIYSVRFIGDAAYLVTYEQVDPLFVVDLSDPENPVVKGELKIPGFSEYLHPIDENTLLGFGKNTVMSRWGGSSEDGLKLALFDVSDPTDPREIASYLLGNAGSSSEVLNNHKAFLYDPQRKLVGFPATIWTSTGATPGSPWSGDNHVTFSGYLLLEVREDGFVLYGTLPSDSEGPAEGFNRSDAANAIERGLYIGDTFYTVSSGRIRAYALDTLELIGELAY